MKRKLLTILSIVLVAAVAVSATSFLKFRKEINDTERLASYRLVTGIADSGSERLVKKLIKDLFNQKVKNSSSRSHLFLHLINDSQTALEYGYQTDSLNNRFIIARSGNGLFVIGNDDASVNRALYYLVFKLTDENGRLLLKQGERFVEESHKYVNVQSSTGIPLSDYGIEYPKNCEKYADMLNYYISQACNMSLLTTTKDFSRSIDLNIQPSLYNDCQVEILSDVCIRISANSAVNLVKGLEQFANEYLGYMFAGTEREKISAVTPNIIIRNHYQQVPWIIQREPILTLWNTNYPRGIYLNDSTSLKTDLMSYSDEQLYEYVKMMKYCGFTGIQVTDMCSAWAGAGGYEYVHERLRLLADAAHSLNMSFTLWVWGAEFTGYGWVDNTVTYSKGNHDYARENPEVINTFDKYYSIYASLADVTDRLIAHYYDPGNLSDSDDIAFFANMLVSKFREVNPEVAFGVNCWVDAYDKKSFVNALGNNITLYENGSHSNEADYESFRGFCAKTGCMVGTWAWNNCEMEIDQLAQMNYQPHIAQNTYLTAAKYDSISKPEYWSEMDSNHVINIFSLYAGASLLQDPNQDLSTLTYKIASEAVGDKYAADFADILTLVEDARSGRSVDEFTWSSENYILSSNNYDSAAIITRSDKAIQTLEQMIAENPEANTLPLPISLCDLLKLILPQINQIKEYAQFRSEYDTLINKASAGESPEILLETVNHIKKPISEYNTVIGLWGQIEARNQQLLLYDFCQKYDLPWEPDPTFKQAQKNIIYSYFVSSQKGHSEPVMQYEPYFQYGVAYGNDYTISLVEELIQEGLFSKDFQTGGIYITDWEHYKYNFN